jgi:transposase
MPNKRLSMRKIRQILKLRFERGLGIRAIALSISASPSTVFECLTRAKAAGISWPLAPDLDDRSLENKLYPAVPEGGSRRAQPDFEHIHRELRRKGVTLQLLWQEYQADHPEDGYQYSKFCEHYSRWRKKVDVVMRQTHRAGEKTFVDFSGDGIEIVDPNTGEIREAPLFLAVLGASSYTYAEAFQNQQLPCWIDGHIHAFEYFGGVTEITVPDNTKTGVTHPCFYEPDINATYLDLAEHYDTTVIPARVKRPKDKAKVENAVLVAQRWILAALRNHTFFSLAEANKAIAEKLEALNNRPFQKLAGSRRTLYETIDRAALKPLPLARYEFGEWSKPRVNIDYHVEIHKHYYSVPYTLVHERMEARATATTVEIFFRGKRVASHRRSYLPGRFTTCKEHMPREHQQYLEWSPSRILNWARKTGPATASLAEQILAAKRHPEQGYRACLGLLRLGKAYGQDRLEAACVRALAIGTHSYKSVQSILKTGLDAQPLAQETEQAQPALFEHENIRGSDYYQ